MMNMWTENSKSSLRVFKVGNFYIFQHLKQSRPNPHTVYEDPTPPDQKTKELEAENQSLRRKLDSLERELQAQSPTRSGKKSLYHQQQPPALDDCGTTLFKLNALSLDHESGLGSSSPAKMTPGRKVRKLTTRKWDLGDENEIDGF